MGGGVGHQLNNSGASQVAAAAAYPNPIDALSFLNQHQSVSAGFGGFASKLSELQAYNPYTSLASMISGLTAANSS